jgi:hypothetical protein
VKLTNRQHAVLTVLREGGEWTCQNLADEVRRRHPCPVCREPPRELGEIWMLPAGSRCGTCHGWGVLPFSYSDAYTALKALREKNLAGRRLVVDEWGDQTNRFVYYAVGLVSADALEAIWDAPAYDPPHPPGVS